MERRQPTRNRRFLPIVLALLCSLLIAGAQLAFKLGSDEASLSTPLSFLASWEIWTGVMFYLVAFLSTLVAYKYGELTIVFPLISVSLGWNILFATLFLGELITPWRLLGTGCIFLGALTISRSA